MATYTPNYNLAKPEPTDAFQNYLSSFNNNMDTIDQHLGGGGGSSTLAGLSDVSLTTPVTGDALIYDGAEWANTPLSAVALSGDYSDLTNTPSIPTNTSDLNNDSGFLTSADISAVGLSGDYSDLINAPSLAAVATSGDYGDLLNKPTIPTVNDGTLTIQQNGTTVGTFTANQSGNTTVNLTGGGGSKHTIVNESGTALADEPNLQFTDGLTASDDSGNNKTKAGINTTFTEASTRANIASGDSFSTILGKIKKFFTDLKTVAFTGAYSDLSGKPTNVSQFTNDSGYITSSGTAANVSGTVAIANGGTGATTRLDAAKNLTNEEVTAPTHVVGLTNNWGEFGWTTLANLVTALGVVKKSGDTMTGLLTINRNSDVQATFSRQNTGTSSAITSIDIGNNVADGTAGSTYGRIRLFGKGAYRTNIYASLSSANRDIEFPNKSGTVALTSDLNDHLLYLTQGGAQTAYGITATNDILIDIPDVSGKVNKSGDYMSGNLYIGGSGAGGYLNGSASNGGCNSIMIGDDVWLGDVDGAGILGMKSTGNDCGFQFKKSNGNNIGKLYSNNGTLKFDSNTIIHSGNIGSQSVSSATSADTSTKDACPRVESKNLNTSSNINGGTSTAKFSECGPSCTNLPDSAWYFILSLGSADSNYGAQLAIGMTTDSCWVRRKDGGGWRSWIRLV